MKLGILVVYMLVEENEKLLDIHLNQIENHTQVPYTIYGSVNRLLPVFRKKLDQHPAVKICECTQTDLRSTREHSFYLEQLVKMGIDDDMTHLVTLHLDSFPIRTGWAQQLANKLTGSTVMATVVTRKYRGPYTACLFFTRDFYLKYNPKFFLSPEDRDSPQHEQFYKHFNPNMHSGTGYLYRVFTEGLSWYAMRKTNKGKDTSLVCIYDDLIFHLGGGVRYHKKSTRHSNKRGEATWIHFLFRMNRVIKPFVPKFIRKFYKKPADRIAGSIRVRHILQDLTDDSESLLNKIIKK